MTCSDLPHARGSNPRPPAYQTSALPTRRKRPCRLDNFAPTSLCSSSSLFSVCLRNKASRQLGWSRIASVVTRSCRPRRASCFFKIQKVVLSKNAAFSEFCVFLIRVFVGGFAERRQTKKRRKTLIFGKTPRFFERKLFLF